MAPKDNRKVLNIHLDTLQPVDAEVYSILHGFKSSIECKNYLMSAVLYYSRSPLVLAANALVESLGMARFSDSFSNVCEKLDAILLEIRSSKIVSVESPAGLDVGVSSSSGSVLDANTKSALVQLRQKFKV